MPYRKNYAKPLRKFQRRFRKRYQAKKGLSTKVAKLYRRVNNIQRSTEVKFITTKINPTPLNISAGVPYIQALDVPSQGIGTSNRVGSKCQFIHHSGKLRFFKQNFGDKNGSTTYKAYVIWLKNCIDVENGNASFLPDDIFNRDYDNQISPLSYFNNRAYGNWLASHKTQGTIVDKTPISAWAGTPGNAMYNSALARLPQQVNKYHTFNKRLNITSEWQTTESGQSPPLPADQYMARLKPYLVIVCDATSTQPPSSGLTEVTGNYDDIFSVRGSIRLSFTDQ